MVRAALRFQHPGRLPVRTGSTGGSGMLRVPRRTEDREERDGLRFDHWGCGWEQTATKNVGQAARHPLSSACGPAVVCRGTTVPSITTRCGGPAFLRGDSTCLSMATIRAGTLNE